MIWMGFEKYGRTRIQGDMWIQCLGPGKHRMDQGVKAGMTVSFEGRCHDQRIWSDGKKLKLRGACMLECWGWMTTKTGTGGWHSKLFGLIYCFSDLTIHIDCTAFGIQTYGKLFECLVLESSFLRFLIFIDIASDLKFLFILPLIMPNILPIISFHQASYFCP